MNYLVGIIYMIIFGFLAYYLFSLRDKLKEDDSWQSKDAQKCLHAFFPYIMK